jgi:sarcosine oxidase subunit beta
VVGGGIAGAATAFFAARAGLSVAVLERRRRLATLTTPVATGAFRLQFDNPEELALVREGVELFDAFAERTGLAGWDLGLRHQGYLFASLTEAAAARARRLVDRQRSWGLDDVELLSGDEARTRFPYLSADVRQARFRSADGWLDPLRLALGYAAAASDPSRIRDGRPGPGAIFLTGTEVTGFLRDADRVRGVRTSRGDLAAGQTVIAAGPFSAQVAALAGVRLEIRPTRRQKLVFPELPEVPADAPMTIEDETGVHWRPALGGCFALWTDPDTPPEEPLDEVPTSAAWALEMLDPASDHALARVAPFWRDVWERGAPGWLLQAGQYEYTPDHRPYLGPSGVPGLSVNAGYSGHGIMTSAAGSRLVVDAMLGAPPGAEGGLGAFRVDRPMAVREQDVL